MTFEGEALIKSLFLKSVNGDILALVHLSNSFRRLSEDKDTAFIEAGEKIDSKMEIVEIENISSGTPNLNNTYNFRTKGYNIGDSFLFSNSKNTAAKSISFPGAFQIRKHDDQVKGQSSCYN